MPNTELGLTLDKLSSISLCAKSDPTFRFLSLAHHLNAGFLKDCYLSLGRNKAVGVDKVNWREYGRNIDEKLNQLVQKLKNKSFKPLPSKRVYIPKGKHDVRPLGISAIESKIVECAIARIMGKIYEADFYDCSYGYRPNKNAHQAFVYYYDVGQLLLSCWTLLSFLPIYIFIDTKLSNMRQLLISFSSKQNENVTW